MQEKSSLYFLRIALLISLVFFCVIVPGVVFTPTLRFDITSSAIRVPLFTGIALLGAGVFFSLLREMPVSGMPLVIAVAIRIILGIFILIMLGLTLVRFLLSGLYN